MTTATTTTGHVGSTRLADGLLVQMVGVLGVEQLPTLRQVLLVPLPAGCRDVIVDAGALEEPDDAVLAVLMAACEWIESQGARFALSGSSPALQTALSRSGLSDVIPSLADLPGPPRPHLVPQQRSGG